MIEKKFQRMPERWWNGRKVRTLVDLQNGNMKIAKGTICTVTRKYQGLTLVSEPCDKCRVGIRISKVSYGELELVQDESNVASIVWLVEKLDYDDYPQGIQGICSTKELAEELERKLKADDESQRRNYGIRPMELDMFGGEPINLQNKELDEK